MIKGLMHVCAIVLYVSTLSIACKGDGEKANPDVPKPSPTARATAEPTSQTTSVDSDASTYTAFAPTGAVRGKVRIAWTVESSENTYGFNVYRQMRGTKGWERVNEKPILAADGGTTSVPQNYEIIDTHKSLYVGMEYFYWLQEVKTDGQKVRAWWPPKSVIVRVPLDEEFPPTAGSK